MKLPDAFHQFLHKTPKKEEAYLSLVVTAQIVQVAVWTIPAREKPHIGDSETERVEADSWQKRLEACDRAIARLAEKEGRDDFEKVVLGLPAYYLTSEDDIEHHARGYIKKLTEELELTPVGFVSLHQAIVHMMKREEGVAPSVILFEGGPQKSTVILYKVGAVIARAVIDNEDIVLNLERSLKECRDIEVLPSRVLLYGSPQETLESYKRDLLKHPWPTRANFLHYPKIDLVPPLATASAVSLAGASELTNQMGEMSELFQPVVSGVPAPTESASVKEKEEEEEEGKREDVIADNNIVEVAPEELGFTREEKVKKEHDVRPRGTSRLQESFMRVLSRLRPRAMRVTGVPKIAVVGVICSGAILAGGWWIAYWKLPMAKVTLFKVPKSVSSSASVVVDPTVTVVDPKSKIAPGRKQEKTVAGEKTIAVTGKKDIGDPARGMATIYNKSLTARTFKKGTTLESESLVFTLDADLVVSAATVTGTLGTETKTFGKTTGAITAAKLGSQSNLPANKEFSISDVTEDVAVAINDAALSGGTSKVVTVVSRADQNALVEALTKELVEKAKNELAATVGGGERLIDETIKTSLTSKTFDAELNEEKDNLKGSVTVSISGISYNEGDVASLFSDLVKESVPPGYTLEESGARVDASDAKVKKDGSITLNASFHGQALATVDLSAIQAMLAGKSVDAAQGELRAIEGVGGVEIDILRSLKRTTLPTNVRNITVSAAVLE